MSSSTATTKVLIQTLTEVPDIQLLQELFAIIKKTSSLVIPDLRKLFLMLSSLYQSSCPKIINLTFQLNAHINKIMLCTQVQISWQILSKSLILLCGEENSDIRKKARNRILEIIRISNNSSMVLQKLYYEGLENESTIVMIYSIKLIFKIFEDSLNILSKKSCVNIVKLIIEKMIRLTQQQNHMDLQNNANHFLNRLFFLKIDKMDQVLQRVDHFYLKTLEKLWAKNKQNILYKHQQQQLGLQKTAQSKQKLLPRIDNIKYQHLPLINDLFFGVYQPFVMKNLFNPDTQAAKKYSITEFKNLYSINQQHLTKYINSIVKIIQRLLSEKHLQILELLTLIVSLPGIMNIINLGSLLEQLIDQLDSDNVLYRRQLRGILQKINHLNSDLTIKVYEKVLKEEGGQIESDEYLKKAGKKEFLFTQQIFSQQVGSSAEWLKVYEILCLIEHWAQNADSLKCYPPTFDFVVKYTSQNLNSKVAKIRSQCEKLFYFILQKFSGYRQNLERDFSPEIVAHFEDVMQSRKPYKLPLDKRSKDAKDTFAQEYEQQRRRFLQNENRRNL